MTLRIQPPAPSPDFPEPWRFSIAPGVKLFRGGECRHEFAGLAPQKFCPSCERERQHAEMMRKAAEASKVAR